MRRFPTLPFDPVSDDDKLKEECGVFGVIGVSDAANFVALGLHALQHRGQEAVGIVSYDGQEFYARRGLGQGYRRDCRRRRSPLRRSLRAGRQSGQSQRQGHP